MITALKTPHVFPPQNLRFPMFAWSRPSHDSFAAHADRATADTLQLLLILGGFLKWGPPKWMAHRGKSY